MMGRKRCNFGQSLAIPVVPLPTTAAAYFCARPLRPTRFPQAMHVTGVSRRGACRQLVFAVATGSICRPAGSSPRGPLAVQSAAGLVALWSAIHCVPARRLSIIALPRIRLSRSHLFARSNGGQGRSSLLPIDRAIWSCRAVLSPRSASQGRRSTRMRSWPASARRMESPPLADVFRSISATKKARAAALVRDDLLSHDSVTFRLTPEIRIASKVTGRNPGIKPG